MRGDACDATTPVGVSAGVCVESRAGDLLPALPSVEACKLWLRHGSCAYGDECRFAHDPGRAGEWSGACGGAAAKNAAVVASGCRRRNHQRTHGRAAVFQRWLLATFARELDAAAVGEGEGEGAATAAVLDVAGGRGELSFLLRNLNGVDAIVFDPRFHTTLLPRVVVSFRPPLTPTPRP